MTFELQDRYYVVKYYDAKVHLTEDEWKTMARLSQKIGKGLEEEGRKPLKGIFIEEDWPEYQVVLDLLTKRCS